MTEIGMLAIDLAKGGFQVCAVGPDGAVLYNRAVSRTRLAARLTEKPAGVVAMEGVRDVASLGASGAGARPRGSARSGGLREAERGRARRDDRADAEAIAEAAMRPTMRFVAVKSAETQGRASPIGLEPMAP